MSQDLAKSAADRGIRYFLISFVDLFGVLRAKLVPASAIGQMQREGEKRVKLGVGHPDDVRHAAASEGLDDARAVGNRVNFIRCAGVRFWERNVEHRSLAGRRARCNHHMLEMRHQIVRHRDIDSR